MEYFHISVLLDEVIDFLKPKLGGNFIDGTLGGMGYSEKLAQLVGEAGKIVAFDMDSMAIENAKVKIKNQNIKNIVLINDNFKNIKKKISEDQTLANIKYDGLVLDLGLSSAQLEDRTRGFSFKIDAPLDMAFGGSENSEISTKDIVNFWKQRQLEEILYKYGEEKYTKRIVSGIIKARNNRPIETTGELVKIIEMSVPLDYTRKKIHFATKTFQALRIATNKELENLEIVLSEFNAYLKKGARVAVVTFHSLEDKIVKNIFKKEATECICPPKAPECVCEHKARLKIITKKPVLPSQEELKNNPRSRSAKLRVVEII